MLRTIIATEQDGLETRVLALNFEVPSADFDLKGAVKAACLEYCRSEEGRSVYERQNSYYFNWGDFDTYVPNVICQKFGFKKIEPEAADETVLFDELLVDVGDVCGDESEMEYMCKFCGAVFEYDEEVL